jgi:hypothetical protein
MVEHCHPTEESYATLFRLSWKQNETAASQALDAVWPRQAAFVDKR